MSQSCSQCAALEAWIARLQAENNMLRQRLAAVAAGLRSLTQLAEREQTEPTMPRKNVLPAIATRAEYLTDLAEGKH